MPNAKNWGGLITRNPCPQEHTYTPSYIPKMLSILKHRHLNFVKFNLNCWFFLKKSYDLGNDWNSSFTMYRHININIAQNMPLTETQRYKNIFHSS